MPNEPVVSVRGEAFLEVEPEIAVVWVSVMARDKERRRAVELLADRTKLITGQIKGYGDAVEKLDSGRVSVRPEFKDGKPRERIAGYLAEAGLTATVADFGVLGELVGALAGSDMVAVTGPDWRLRPASPVYREARLVAAEDAMGRARDYAEAFGATITGLTEAADAGMLAEARPQRPMAAARALARQAAPAAADQPEFDLEPAKQTVRAQVEARFTMTAPTLGR